MTWKTRRLATLSSIPPGLCSSSSNKRNKALTRKWRGQAKGSHFRKLPKWNRLLEAGGWRRFVVRESLCICDIGGEDYSVCTQQSITVALHKQLTRRMGSTNRTCNVLPFHFLWLKVSVANSFQDFPAKPAENFFMGSIWTKFDQLLFTNITGKIVIFIVLQCILRLKERENFCRFIN